MVSIKILSKKNNIKTSCHTFKILKLGMANFKSTLKNQFFFIMIFPFLTPKTSTLSPSFKKFLIKFFSALTKIHFNGLFKRKK